MKDLTILIQGPFFEFKGFDTNKNIKILKKIIQSNKKYT